MKQDTPTALESDPSLGTIARLFDFVRSPVIMPNGIAHEFFGQKVRTTPLAQLPASWRYHRSYVEFARSTLGRMLGRLSVKEREKIYSALPGLREELASSAR